MALYTGLWTPTLEHWTRGNSRLGNKSLEKAVHDMWRNQFALQRDYSATQNPLSLSISEVTTFYWGQTPTYTLLMGAEVSGSDPYGLIHIQLVDLPMNTSTATTQTPMEETSRL